MCVCARDRIIYREVSMFSFKIGGVENLFFLCIFIENVVFFEIERKVVLNRFFKSKIIMVLDYLGYFLLLCFMKI